MTEKYTREQFEADKEAYEERKAKEEQARREKMEKETARLAWLAEGGNEGDFEREWPQLQRESRRRRVIEREETARAESARRTRQSF